MTNRVNCWEPAKAEHHNVASNGKRDGLRSSGYVAISSEASKRLDERSTTNVYFLTNLGYNISFLESEYETTRVRGYQNLLDLFRRNAFKHVLQEQESMQRMCKILPFGMEKGQSRKKEVTKNTGVRKGRRQVQGIYKAVSFREPRKAQVSQTNLGSEQQGLSTREAERTICCGRRFPQFLKIAQLSETQEITYKYTEMGNKRHVKTHILRGHYENRGHRYTTSCRPYSAFSWRWSFWINSALEPKGNSLHRKLQKEQYFGRRYSLDLDRKAKKQYLNGTAITNRNRIWDISKIPLPFTDMIGMDTSAHPYKE